MRLNSYDLLIELINIIDTECTCITYDSKCYQRFQQIKDEVARDKKFYNTILGAIYDFLQFGIGEDPIMLGGKAESNEVLNRIEDWAKLRQFVIHNYNPTVTDWQKQDTLYP